MSDAASENDSKRPRMANPYLKQKPAVEVLIEESSTTNNAPVARLLAADETEPNIHIAAAAAAAARDESTFGEKEPAVERLPSRNVSFGSAEILTVIELHQHVLLYSNQSVRITGVVLRRLVAADGNLCLVLGDPSKAQGIQQLPSIIKTPGGIKRRGTAPLLVSRKRPLSTIKKKTPLETVVTSRAEQQTVLVYAVSKQVPVNDVAVGDLAMIIGELRSTCNTTVAAIQPIVDHKKISTSHFLHARIVENVNGTDIQLHDEALRMRREHLLQMCPESKDPIRQGCGPPPYYDTNRKEASV
jgi:hypothetical protein